MAAQLGDTVFLSGFLQQLLFALLFILMVAGWFVLRKFPGRLRSIRGANWPFVEGKIETVNVNTFAEQAIGEIGYSYSVAGKRYSGYFSRQFADQQDAWDYVGPLKGQSVIVRYKPKSPDLSVIHSADQNPLLEAPPKKWGRRLLSLLAALVLGDSEGQRPDNVPHP